MLADVVDALCDHLAQHLAPHDGLEAPAIAVTRVDEPVADHLNIHVISVAQDGSIRAPDQPVGAPTPLRLRVRFLLSSSSADPWLEMQQFSLAMKALHEHPIIELKADGDRSVDTGTVSLTLAPLSVEEVAPFWPSGPFRLAAAYEMAGVQL